MKNIFIISIFILLQIACSSPGNMAASKETNAEKQTKITRLINSQNYVFMAQSALPMTGRNRQLTSEYDLRVSKDSVIAFLPYFGRAYTAPISPTDNGIQFTSTDFAYTLSERGDKGWTISIKPKDNKGVEQLNLEVSVDGFASLQVTSTNRQPISFNGVVVERRAR